MLIVTTEVLPGHLIRRVIGEVFGVAVDSGRPAGGSSNSGTFRMTGERSQGLAAVRREAVERLADEARRLGASAVIGMSFDTVALGDGHEVCAYGTAVWAEPAGEPAGGQDAAAREGARQATPQPPQTPQPPPGGPPMMARNLTMGLEPHQPR